MDKPMKVDGKRILEVTFRPAVEDYLPAAWTASQLGWKRAPHAVGEGKTPEAAAGDWSRLTGIPLSECEVQIQGREQ